MHWKMTCDHCCLLLYVVVVSDIFNIVWKLILNLLNSVKASIFKQLTDRWAAGLLGNTPMPSDSINEHHLFCKLKWFLCCACVLWRTNNMEHKNKSRLFFIHRNKWRAVKCHQWDFTGNFSVWWELLLGIFHPDVHIKKPLTLTYQSFTRTVIKCVFKASVCLPLLTETWCWWVVVSESVYIKRVYGNRQTHTRMHTRAHTHKHDDR